jgi:hypothetical protein
MSAEATKKFADATSRLMIVGQNLNDTFSDMTAFDDLFGDGGTFSLAEGVLDATTGSMVAQLEALSAAAAGGADTSDAYNRIFEALTQLDPELAQSMENSDAFSDVLDDMNQSLIQNKISAEEYATVMAQLNTDLAAGVDPSEALANAADGLAGFLPPVIDDTERLTEKFGLMEESIDAMSAEKAIENLKDLALPFDAAIELVGTLQDEINSLHGITIPIDFRVGGGGTTGGGGSPGNGGQDDGGTIGGDSQLGIIPGGDEIIVPRGGRPGTRRNQKPSVQFIFNTVINNEAAALQHEAFVRSTIDRYV